MGVDKLYKLVVKEEVVDGVKKRTTINDLAREVTLNEFSGDTLCFDASYIIYQSILAMSHVDALTDEDGNTTGHINTIFNKIVMFARQDIKQVWVFDNPKPNPIKEEENARREKERAKRKTDKGRFKMTSKHVIDIIELLKCMGMPYIIAPEGFEAEHYGAVMCAKGICRAILMWGTQLKREKKGKKVIYKMISNKQILLESGLTQEEFITICIALGTDFAPKIKGVGPVTAIKKLSKLKLTPRQEEAKQYILSKLPKNASDFHCETFDKDKLLEYLLKFNFNKIRAEKGINIIKEKYFS